MIFFVKKLIGLLSICVLCILLACNGESKEIKGDKVDEKNNQKLDEQPSLIKIEPLIPRNFSQELLSNGKLEALQKANLKFTVDGTINQINVRENQNVSKGFILASIDKIQQQRNYSQSLLRYKQAALDYEDQLLRLGFKISDTATMDRNTKTIARIRSGFANAELELQKAKVDLGNTALSTPFNGKIANLKAKLYNTTNNIEYFCTLINDSELLLEFLVLEQELTFIRKCKTVTVAPFNNEKKSYAGTIVSVNPMIDKTGMVAVKAKVQNIDGQLIDGMSVKVKALLAIPNQLVIPKTALLERQGRKVVFTRTSGNTAYWNYVEIAYENSNEYAIKSGLKIGDEVICEGNFNLAHDSPVIIRNKL